MLTKKINEFKFKFASFKVRCAYKKRIRVHLKILKSCLYHMYKIGIPISNVDNIELKALLEVYDESIETLIKDAERYRKYLE